MVVLSACAHPAAQLPPTPAPSASPTLSDFPSPSPSPTQASATHVFVIVMENHTYSQALAGRYVSQLAAHYPTSTNYHSVASPSLPNYLAMTSGSTWGISDDNYHQLPAGGLGAQLTAAGTSWRAYMEGMTNGCLRDTYPYAVKHNPFAYYGGNCPQQVVPFTHFAADMRGNVPDFVWITPGLCHDGHDCSESVADQWLSQTVPTILATSAWQQDGLLLITWDEGGAASNHVLTLAIHPHATTLTSNVSYDHYSLLATLEDRLGVGRLGRAADATPMTDLLATASGF